MRALEASDLSQEIEALCLDVSTVLPSDVQEALAEYRKIEESPAGRSVIDQILENARVAAELKVPLCQDTGFFTVYLSLSPDTIIKGDLTGAAASGVSEATLRGGLRASIVTDPPDERLNTGDNTPPILEVALSSGEESSLGVIAKGGGSEMASRMAMLPPGAGWDGILAFVVGVVRAVGARACPPLVLGVGVGGSFDHAPKIAKESLMRPLDVDNPDPKLKSKEDELTTRVNRLGIGPGAVGGTVTCIGTRISEAPCHIAGLPVAVSIGCHSLRRKTIPIQGWTLERPE